MELEKISLSLYSMLEEYRSPGHGMRGSRIQDADRRENLTRAQGEPADTLLPLLLLWNDDDKVVSKVQEFGERSSVLAEGRR